MTALGALLGPVPLQLAYAAFGGRLCQEIVARRVRSSKYMSCCKFALPPQSPKPMERGSTVVRHLERGGHAALAQKLLDYNSFSSQGCLIAYTSEAESREFNVYSAVNLALKTDNFGDFGPYIYNMTKEMKALPVYTCPERLWRAQRLTAEDLRTWARPGQAFLNPTFMSSSRKKEVAEVFLKQAERNCLIEIDCSKNTNGAGLTYAVDISSFSMFKKEVEVLFYCYSGFRVISVSSKPHAEKGLLHHVVLETLDTLRVESAASAAGGA